MEILHHVEDGMLPLENRNFTVPITLHGKKTQYTVFDRRFVTHTSI